jgi:hypothetical protein
MRTGTLVVAIIAATFAACSLTTELDGLTGGATATGDGGTSGGPEAGGSDAPATFEAGDASMSSDGDAGPIDPCVGTVFCDTFERAAPQGSWTSFYTESGGTAAIDSTTSTSPTRSLLINIPAAGSPHAQFTSPGYPNVNHVRLSFSMKAGAPNRATSLMRLQLDANSRAAVMDLFMFDGRYAIDENVFGAPSGSYADYAVSAGFIPDTWQRWSLELDARAPTAVGIVTLDGVERLRTNLVNSFVKGDVSILMGSFYSPDGPAQSVHFDDVALTILP